MKVIKVNRIKFQHLIFNKKKGNTDKAGNIHLQNVNILINDIAIDSNTVKDSSRLLFAKKIQIQFHKSRFFTSDSLYKISTDRVHFSTIKGQADIIGLKVKPRYPDQSFENHFNYRQDRFKVSIDSLSFFGLHPKNLREKHLFFRKLVVNDAKANIYLDAALPIKKVEKPLPQKILRHAGMDLSIDTVALKDVDIKYRERNPKSKKVGAVTFNKIHGTITHITNDSIGIKENPFCKVNLHALFMQQGKLHATFNFDLTHPQNIFSYKGTLGFLNATTLNPATRPLGMVGIKTGKIYALSYDMNADNHGAAGTVHLKYDSLKVKVLTENNQASKLKKQGLISLATNLLIINSSNLHDSLSQQQSKIHYQRDRYRSVFNLMWKSIFTGIKPLVGMDENN